MMNFYGGRRVMNNHNYLNNKKSFYLMHLLSFFVLIICIDNIYVINNWFKITSYFYLVRVAVIIFLVLYEAIYNRKLISKATSIIGLYFIIMLFTTLLRQGSFISALNVTSRPVLIVLFLDFFWADRYLIFKTWLLILYILVIFDGMSMIIYPNGMYLSSYFSMYTQNWFLGYKTARYEYSMALCVISGYLSYYKKSTYDVFFFFTFILCSVELTYSQSTGALISLMFIGIVCFIFNASNCFKTKHSIYKFFNGKTVVLSYSIILIIIWFLEEIPFARFVVENILDKDVSLTGRRYIWDVIINSVNDNLLLGLGYFGYNDYVNITKILQGGSAHNLVLAIIVSSGILGLCMYILLIITSMNSKADKYNNNQSIFNFSIIAYLLVGISSDSMYYSFFGFPLFVCLYLEINRSLLGKQENDKGGVYNEFKQDS